MRSCAFVPGSNEPRPPEPQNLDQLTNSGADGKSVLFWEKATLGCAKFYKLAEALPPTPNVGRYAHLTLTAAEQPPSSPPSHAFA